MYYNVFFVIFFWRPCMYNGGLLPDIILLTQCYYHWVSRLNAMKMFCLCSLLSHLLSVLTFSPLCGMLRRSRCVQIFLKKI